jgi:transcriptional regulator with XRE-family HTH domain
MHLGIKIKIARLSKKLTQQDLADKIGKTRPLVSHIEQTGKVNHQTLLLISKALDISLEEIETIVNEPTKKGKPKAKDVELQDEIDRLKEENATLKELVKSQKDVIEMLKAKRNKR